MSTEVLRREEAVALAENREARCPCVLLLDTSSSMRGSPKGWSRRRDVSRRTKHSNRSFSLRWG
jgi:uncharacterized protein with von Willebrand factor type A (vWA) domain